ncbi:MAG: exodeoxyribonuclease V subunit gamma [Sedimentisphaerales bacterium]|nr:exodeoxyribonuclease V subunit gamma [Sedimentisphaerales bacterium]
MTVRFVLGTSGTGKTHYCIEQIAAELQAGPHGPLLLFLVPEQATHQTTLEVLARLKAPGFHRLRIISFDRLRQLVLGTNMASTQVSEIGRYMLIQKVLSDLSGRLEALDRSQTRPGWAGAIAQTIISLYDHAVSEDQLEQLVRSLRSSNDLDTLAAKLADIATIAKEYHRQLAGRFIDPQVELARTREAIRSCQWLEGSKCWVDGFAGFTGFEMLMLQELLQQVCLAEIALCLDPDAIDLADPSRQLDDLTRPFYPTESTYCQLLQGTASLGIPIDQPILLRKQRRFASGTSLWHVEASIYRSRTRMPADDRIRILQAPDPRTEVEAVARTIRALVQEEGLRYRQIAIICPNITTYEPYLRACLSRFSIPFFLDSPRPLARHPLGVLLLKAMEVVVGGFQTEDILEYAKTGLTSIDDYKLAELQSYCQAFGIGPADWLGTRPWTYRDHCNGRLDLDQVNATGMDLIRPLLQLKVDLAGQIAAADLVRALRRLLETLETGRALANWVQWCQADGDQSTSQEHQQASSMVDMILEELVEVFGPVTATAWQWFEILKAAVSQARLALIPPTLDQVLVGTIERSRHPELEVAFIVGATQRDFPSPLPDAGILSGADLERAGSMGVRLGPQVSELLASWRYLAYVAFTRARRQLVVSYPLQDQRGTSLEPSPLVKDLMDLFEGLEPMDATDAIDTYSPQDWYDLMELAFKGRVDRQEALESLGSACPPSIQGWLQEPLATGAQQVLDDEVVRQLFANGLYTSSSRLETYAACPFQYFARYVLGVGPAARFELRPLELGELYHLVLRELVARYGPNLLIDEEEALAGYVDKTLWQVVDADPFLSTFASRGRFQRYQLERACRTLTDCLLDMVKVLKAGLFRPYIVETAFGRQDDPLGQTRLDLPDGMPIFISGRIDRADMATSGERHLVIVTDYKTGERSFDWSDLWHCLDLQLPIYLIAIESAAKAGLIDAEPVGAFYWQVELWPSNRSPQVRKARGIFDGSYHLLLDGSARRQSNFYSFYVTKEGQPYGSYTNRDVLRPEDFRAVLAYARQAIITLGQQITKGLIPALPARYTDWMACHRCDYKALCRFEPDYGRYRQLSRIKKKNFLDRVQDK